MIKSRELSDPNSCLNRAKENERLFVLLEHDDAAPATVRFWVGERIRLGKNRPTDEQIESALKEAMAMDKDKTGQYGMNHAGQDPFFDRTIGLLDYILSMLMLYAKAASRGEMSEANRQTLKHHAEDMEAAAKAIYKRLGFQEGVPQPSCPG